MRKKLRRFLQWLFDKPYIDYARYDPATQAVVPVELLYTLRRRSESGSLQVAFDTIHIDCIDTGCVRVTTLYKGQVEHVLVTNVKARDMDEGGDLLVLTDFRGSFATRVHE